MTASLRPCAPGQFCQLTCACSSDVLGAQTTLGPLIIPPKRGDFLIAGVTVSMNVHLNHLFPCVVNLSCIFIYYPILQRHEVRLLPLAGWLTGIFLITLSSCARCRQALPVLPPSTRKNSRGLYRIYRYRPRVHTAPPAHYAAFTNALRLWPQLLSKPLIRQDCIVLQVNLVVLIQISSDTIKAQNLSRGQCIVIDASIINQAVKKRTAWNVA